MQYLDALHIAGLLRGPTPFSKWMRSEVDAAVSARSMARASSDPAWIPARAGMTQQSN